MEACARCGDFLEESGAGLVCAGCKERYEAAWRNRSFGKACGLFLLYFCGSLIFLIPAFWLLIEALFNPSRPPGVTPAALSERVGWFFGSLVPLAMGLVLLYAGYWESGLRWRFERR